MTQILIVEDEPRIAAFLKKGLESEGYATALAANGDDATAIAIAGAIDLVLLDLGLPGKDGLLVLDDLRGQGFLAPVIVLTARDDLNHKISSLDLGADDYITKPFSFEELLARIRARLRTANVGLVPNDMCLQLGSFTLDIRTRTLKGGGGPIELSAREFILLETFMRHPGQVMSREQLLDRVWGYDYEPGSNIVDVYVGYLRKKLGAATIETVRGMGYRMPCR
ncbi:MAG: response regulator transcription factor [Elainellaceae cyanobacterium]